MQPNQHQPTTSSEPSQHQVLTPQLISDLLTLLKDPKPQVQHQTLNVILQYTTLPSSKQKFQSTPLISLLIKYLFTPQLTTICLSNLINLSTEQCFHNQFTTVIEPLIIQMQQWNESPLPLELAALLLINLSKIEECVEVIVGKEEKEGYCLFILFGFLRKPKIGAYVANVCSNVTAFEAGRGFFARGCVPVRIQEFIFSGERDKRMGVIKAIRNTLFQWENQKFISKLLQQQYHFIDNMILYLIYVLSSSTQLLKQPYNFEPLLKHTLTSEQQSLEKLSSASHYREKELEELILSIELLLILTNVDFNTLKPVYKKEEFRELLAVVGRIELPEEEKDKLEALSVFFC